MTWCSFPSLAPAPLRWWLLHRASLTALLRARCDVFAVRPVRQGFAPVHGDERALLGLRGVERAWVREVQLVCDGVPVVYAHSVMGRRQVQGAWRGLKGLGNRSLGSVLFANPRVQRGAFEFKALGTAHGLYARAARVLQAPPYSPGSPHNLWARRSMFVLQGQGLLVTEVFLPTVLDLKSR